MQFMTAEQVRLTKASVMAAYQQQFQREWDDQQGLLQEIELDTVSVTHRGELKVRVGQLFRQPHENSNTQDVIFPFVICSLQLPSRRWRFSSSSVATACELTFTERWVSPWSNCARTLRSGRDWTMSLPRKLPDAQCHSKAPTVSVWSFLEFPFSAQPAFRKAELVACFRYFRVLVFCVLLCPPRGWGGASAVYPRCSWPISALIFGPEYQ